MSECLDKALQNITGKSIIKQLKKRGWERDDRGALIKVLNSMKYVVYDVDIGVFLPVTYLLCNGETWLSAKPVKCLEEKSKYDMMVCLGGETKRYRWKECLDLVEKGDFKRGYFILPIFE